MIRSIADEVMDILAASSRPKSMKQINRLLGDKYPSSQISASISYWEKKGVIIGQVRDGYKKNKEYILAE